MRKSLIPARSTARANVLGSATSAFMTRETLFLQQGKARSYQARTKRETRDMNAEVADASTLYGGGEGVEMCAFPIHVARPTFPPARGRPSLPSEKQKCDARHECGSR